MHVMPRLPLLSGLLLLAVAPLAVAESPLPDPIAPAVIGRPLDKIGPARATRPKPAGTKQAAHATTASSSAIPPIVTGSPALFWTSSWVCWNSVPTPNAPAMPIVRPMPS